MCKLIYAFLPAFLLALNVAGSPRLDTMRTRQKAKEGLSFCRSCRFKCLHLNYKKNKRPRLLLQIAAGA
jgi:hypothetical protein